VLPLSLATATHGLFGSSTLHLERPSSTPNPSLANKSVLVWGAASSVGASAVQVGSSLSLPPPPLHLSFPFRCFSFFLFFFPFSSLLFFSTIFSTLFFSCLLSLVSYFLLFSYFLFFLFFQNRSFFLMKLAARSGYTVIATASPANHSWVTALGAARVFDYNDPDVISKLKGIFLIFFIFTPLSLHFPSPSHHPISFPTFVSSLSSLPLQPLFFPSPSL
jgi:hypothetical protein